MLQDAKCGAEGQNRTVDTSLFRAVLCQLSYLGTIRDVGLRGVYTRSVKIDRRILPREVVEVPHILCGNNISLAGTRKIGKSLGSPYDVGYDLFGCAVSFHHIGGGGVMPSIHLVREEQAASVVVPRVSIFPGTILFYIAVSALLVTAIGTWLVWFSAFIQQNLQEEGIREACQRAMPDTTDRCFDTVIIQRGGGRR
jgi:hypothetical protein